MVQIVHGNDNILWKIQVFFSCWFCVTMHKKLCSRKRNISASVIRNAVKKYVGNYVSLFFKNVIAESTQLQWVYCYCFPSHSFQKDYHCIFSNKSSQFVGLQKCWIRMSVIKKEEIELNCISNITNCCVHKVHLLGFD